MHWFVYDSKFELCNYTSLSDHEVVASGQAYSLPGAALRITWDWDGKAGEVSIQHMTSLQRDVFAFDKAEDFYRYLCEVAGLRDLLPSPHECPFSAAVARAIQRK